MSSAPTSLTSPFDVLHPQITKGLNDKLYEKRKASALEIERLVRELVLTGDHKRIQLILKVLIDEFAYSVIPNARNGGLIALAAVAIALGSTEIEKYLDSLILPIISCFSDQDSRVRYYACESMYNVAKVARGSVLRYFNPVFDSLSKLSTDAEISVKNGAELLDRLIKDIVCEKSLFASVKSKSSKSLDNLNPTLMVPGTVSQSNLAFFDLERFIPLLVERIRCIAPATRIFLVNWISVLDSVPDLELVSHLPQFLDGLFYYLSDPNQDVRTATLKVLGEFLKEIRDIVELQREQGALHEQDFLSSVTEPSLINQMDSLKLEQQEQDPISDLTLALVKKELKSQQELVPGQTIVLDFGKMTKILIPFLLNTDEETQATSLKWIHDFIVMARELMLPFTPLLLECILPTLSHSIQSIKSIAIDTNASLYRLVYDFTNESLSVSSQDVMANLSALSNQSSIQDSKKKLDVKETVNALLKQFQDEHEETRLASLDWVLMLHKNVPKQVMTSDHSTINLLLRNLSDHSEEVVKKDLQLLAQISHSSQDEYFYSFMNHLLNLFSTDRRLLESRGNLIIRQLCQSLNPERMYRTFAEILEREQDIEFASLMVQNLNIILITAPEFSELRKLLKTVDPRDGSNQFFTVIYKSWCHNPISLFSLCLLASAYEHATHLLGIFAELEMTVSFLIQVDKLVQLIESPVFTYMRLQLLEPDRHPYLFKALYGILMLLPQSSAFATLRNRLNSVNSLVTLYAMPGMPSTNSIQAPSPSLGHKRNPSTKSTPSNDYWMDLLQIFQDVQEKHEKYQKTISRPFTGDQNGQSKTRPSLKSKQSSTALNEELKNDSSSVSSNRNPSSRIKMQGTSSSSPLGIRSSYRKIPSASSSLGRR